MANLSKKQIVIIATAAVVVIFFFVLIFANTRKSNQSAQSGSLKIWGTEKKANFELLAQGYGQLHPDVHIDYQEFDPANYDTALLNALASGQGPDVFFVGNRNLPTAKNKLAPATPQQFSVTNVRSLFPQTVENDFVSGGQVYALPLYLDTLSLIYNRDFFAAAGIVDPPKTWTDFQNIVPNLRILSPAGGLNRAAAAIGGSRNGIANAIDILNLLMMQNGAQMTDPARAAATFASTPGANGNPGLSAFNFYLQFANAASQYYAWDDGAGRDMDSFVAGHDAMIFGYRSDLLAIKEKSPFLNVGVAPMPQPAGASVPINYPKYAGLAVSRQSSAKDLAWNFIATVATSPDLEAAFLNATGHPPALNALVSRALQNADFGVFARQALTARSWYEADSAALENIFNDAIRGVLSGQVNSTQALRQAEDQANLLMRQAGQ